MNRNIILIALLCLLSIGRTVAQSVTVEAKIDSLQILIGEQAKVQLQVAMDAKQRAVFPAYTDTLVRGVEIIETAKPDTQFLNDRQRMLITQEYIVTSFDSALYYLPPMPVTVDGKEYRSKALALKVYSMPVDTLHPDQFFGQKTVMKAPFAWEDWYGLIGCSFLALPLLGLLIYLIIRIRDNKPIIRKIKVEPKLPPHQAAMKEIERIKNEKEAISDLKELFQTADLVKFAKHDPQMNENDANLINAIDFINETKQPEEENQKPQPTEITIIEKRSLRTKILLICGIVFLSAALIGTFVYIGMQLYDLFA